MNELKVKVVDVGHGLDGNGAGVTLVEVLVLFSCILFYFWRLMIHSTAQKRWGEVASCTYRVGVELAEAHCAGFNEDVRGF